MNSSNEQVIFEDRFDGALDEGWSWLRENPDRWRIRDSGLEICVEPGDEATVRNALLRQLPLNSSPATTGWRDANKVFGK